MIYITYKTPHRDRFVYICLCHGITESAIRSAVKEGANTFRQLSFMTGCGTQCGSCAPQARILLQQCQEFRGSQETQPLLHVVSAA